MQKERITNVELVSSQQSAVSSPLTRRRFLKGGGAICIGAIALQGLGNFAHAHETGGSTWTIKLTAINPGDGQNTGDDKKAFNWKKKALAPWGQGIPHPTSYA